MLFQARHFIVHACHSAPGLRQEDFKYKASLGFGNSLEQKLKQKQTQSSDDKQVPVCLLW